MKLILFTYPFLWHSSSDIRALFAYTAYTMMRIKLSLRNADTTAFIYISFSDVYIIIYWTLGFEVNITFTYNRTCTYMI